MCVSQKCAYYFLAKRWCRLHKPQTGFRGRWCRLHKPQTDFRRRWCRLHKLQLVFGDVGADCTSPNWFSGTLVQAAQAFFSFSLKSSRAGRTQNGGSGDFCSPLPLVVVAFQRESETLKLRAVYVCIPNDFCMLQNCSGSIFV